MNPGGILQGDVSNWGAFLGNLKAGKKQTKKKQKLKLKRQNKKVK